MIIITQEMLAALRTGSHPDSANEKLYQAASELLRENESLRKQLDEARDESLAPAPTDRG